MKWFPYTEAKLAGGLLSRAAVRFYAAQSAERRAGIGSDASIEDQGERVYIATQEDLLVDTKVCAWCQQRKPKAEFYSRKSGYATAYCMECHAEAVLFQIYVKRAKQGTIDEVIESLKRRLDLAYRAKHEINAGRTNAQRNTRSQRDGTDTR